MSDVKECNRCRKTKPVSDFKIVFGNKIGNSCMECVVARCEKTKKETARQENESPIKVSYRYLNE